MKKPRGVNKTDGGKGKAKRQAHKHERAEGKQKARGKLAEEVRQFNPEFVEYLEQKGLLE